MDQTLCEDRIGWLDREPEYWDLLGEVLELQESADASIGRNPYASLAEGESVIRRSTCPTQESPLEYGLIDEDLDDQVVQAARQTC